MKKKGEMTFKEFWEEEERKSIGMQAVEKDKYGILETLRAKGFTDEQINGMKMEDVQKIVWDELESQMKVLERSASKLLKNSIRASRSFTALWKDEKGRREFIKATLTDKSFRKELFEFADTLANFEAVLQGTEDNFRQAIEELKKIKRKAEGKE